MASTYCTSLNMVLKKLIQYVLQHMHVYLFLQFHRRQHHVHWLSIELCYHCRWYTVGFRSGCECTENYRLSSFANDKTCGREERWGLVRIVHSCLASELHAVSEQCRWVASRYAALKWISASAACTEWSSQDAELPGNHQIVALLLHFQLLYRHNSSENIINFQSLWKMIGMGSE